MDDYGCSCGKWFDDEYRTTEIECVIVPSGAVAQTNDGSISMTVCPACGRAMLYDAAAGSIRWMSEVEASALPSQMGEKGCVDGVCSFDGMRYCRDYSDHLVFYSDAARTAPARAWQLRAQVEMRDGLPVRPALGGYSRNLRMAYLDMLEGINLEGIFSAISDADMAGVLDGVEFAIWHRMKLRYLEDACKSSSSRCILHQSRSHYVRQTFDPEALSYAVWLGFKNRVRHEVLIADACFGDERDVPAQVLVTDDERFCIVFGCGAIVYRLDEPFQSYSFGVEPGQWRDLLRWGGGRYPNRFEWVDRASVRDGILELGLSDGMVATFNLESLFSS